MARTNRVNGSDRGQTSHQPHVDDILQSLNPKGCYQILQTLVTCLSSIPTAFQLLDNVFIVRSVPHRCAAPVNDSTFWNKYSHVENMTVKYEQCQISISSHDDVIATEPCVDGMEFDWPIDYSVASERISGPTFSDTGRRWSRVGAFLITILSDRVGRKVALTGSNLGLLLSGLAIAFAPNFATFAVFKFVVGAFQQGVLTSGTTYILELFKFKVHDHYGILFTAGGILTIGIVSMPFIAYLFRYQSWRYLHLTLTLTSLTAFFQMWYLDESLRWLVANGKTDRALKWIKRAARYNNKDYKNIVKEFATSMDPVADKDSKTALNPKTAVNDEEGIEAVTETQIEETTIHMSALKKFTFIDLLKTRRLLINSVSIWFAWFTVALANLAVYLTATSLYGDPYINFALVAIMNLPGRLMFFVGARRCGRKPILIFMYALVSVSLLTAAVSKHLEENNRKVFGVLTVVTSMTANIGSSGCFGGIFLYTPEMFPTNLRNQALGVSSFMARFGGMLAPFTSVLAAKAVWGPSLVIGGCALVTCLLIGCILPETKGRELPQTLDDLLAWYGGRKPAKEDAAEA